MVLKIILHFIIFVVLTLLTQIGGFAYLLAILAKYHTDKAGIHFSKFLSLIVFVGSYSLIHLGASIVAPYFGRVPLPCTLLKHTNLAMQSPVYCILNRHYVTPELKKIVVKLSKHINQRFPDTATIVLDANFPFINGFPLLPHLSHNDGRKLDLAFYYKLKSGEYLRGKTKSPAGYWAFEEPESEDGLPCEGRKDYLTMRWDMNWFGSFVSDMILETERTRSALEWLVTSGHKEGISKVFIEPHLARKLNVQSSIIRFQGCRAARHDDHIHIQVSP